MAPNKRLLEEGEDGVSLGHAWWVYADLPKKNRFRELQQAASPEDPAPHMGFRHALEDEIIGRLSSGELQAFGIQYGSSDGPIPIPKNYFWKGAEIDFDKDTVAALGRKFGQVTVQGNWEPLAELFGVTPEKATQARRHGAISYVSADQRERVAKAAITREENSVIAAIKKLRSSGEAVPSNSPDQRRHGTSHPISEHAEGRYRAIRRRKLAGEHIPDGEWQWFIDHARRLKDPQYELLRGSPAAFGFTLTV
jgi:hypothetical protein